MMQSILARKANIIDLMARAASGIFAVGRFEHLTKAALYPELSVEAWSAYCDDLSQEPLGNGETRLYPLVAANLKAAGMARLDQKLLAARRTATVQSEIILRAADEVNNLFARHEIAAVFTKGMALQITEYRNPLLRTFSDIDCCIQIDDIPAVVQIAREEGWVNSVNLTPENPHVIEAHAEMTFQLPTGVSLDIHWVLRRAFSFTPELTGDFFATTRLIDWRGQPWRVPSPTWQLIETIEHGITANEVIPIRWLPDAVTLLKNSASVFDWGLVERVAQTTNLQLVFLAGLTNISEHSRNVPQGILERLDVPVSQFQIWEFRARTNLRTTLFDRLRDEALHYFLRAPGSVIARVLRFPAFLIKGAGRSRRSIDLLVRVWNYKTSDRN